MISFPPCQPYRSLSPHFLHIFLLILACLASFPGTSRALAEEPPKAADLVQDGQPIDFNQDKYQQLFKELREEHGFSATELRQIFQGLSIDRQVLVLMDKQWESRPYYTYAPLFITPQTIIKGRELLAQNKALLDRIEATFGVNREVLIAIWGVETRYGANQGKFRVLRVLNTLFDAYPRRSDFFRRELIDFLLLCRENRIDPHGIVGSYAGAFGQTQFIPSSFRKYAVSFDGDARKDVWNSTPDILASIANYLKRSQWVFNAPVYAELGFELKDKRLIAAEQKGYKGRVPFDVVCQAQYLRLPPSPQNKPLSIIGLELQPDGPFEKRYVAGYPNFQAITEWNHSNRYAMAVAELAEAFTQ